VDRLRTRRGLGAWTLAALAGAWLTGCGGAVNNEEGNIATAPPKGSPSGDSVRAAQKAGGASKPRIVLVTNGSSDWWSAVEKGMQDAAAKVGADVESKRNTDGSTEGQIRLLEEAMSTADVKGVAVSVVESEAPGIADAIRKVKDAGKVIITIDSDISPSAVDARRAYIGTNNTKAGEVAGKAAATLRPQGGEVVAFVGTAAAANARERLEGFASGAGAKFAKPSGGNIYEDNADPIKAQSLAQIAVQKHRDAGVLLGLYSYNGPRIAEEASKDADFRKKVTVVTFDLDEQAVDHLEKGDIDVSVCQNPYEIGYQAVRMLKAMVADDKKTIDEMLPNGATTFDTGVRVIVPADSSPVKGDNVITIKAMKEWLTSKGLKSS